MTEHDPVNAPAHYTRFPGVEVIDLTQHLNFCRGNAVKYIARAGAKDPDKEIEDLEKAIFYIQKEIDRLNAAAAPKPAASDWGQQTLEYVPPIKYRGVELHPYPRLTTFVVNLAGETVEVF